MGKDALATPHLLATRSPDDHRAVGRFRGPPNSDILVGRRRYAGGNPHSFVDLPGIPDTDTAKSDGRWYGKAGPIQIAYLKLAPTGLTMGFDDVGHIRDYGLSHSIRAISH